jgi:hypothetical protein
LLARVAHWHLPGKPKEPPGAAVSPAAKERKTHPIKHQTTPIERIAIKKPAISAQPEAERFHDLLVIGRTQSKVGEDKSDGNGATQAQGRCSQDQKRTRTNALNLPPRTRKETLRKRNRNKEAINTDERA